MEDSSQGGSRRGARSSHTQTPRPESSASNQTRMTPSSSNSSTAHLPQRVQDLNGRGSSSVAGSLLQERLRERKVETARQSRRRSIDMSVGAERGVQSSPVRTSVREERRPSSSGIVAGKGMGVKQMEDQVSTLHKQNFDLKLELFHRRQRQETLEARLAVLEKQVDEQAELQEVNEQLLAELEKRDQAVEEAVGIIVTLEDKVERLMQEREQVRTFEASYDSGYTQNDELSSSPPQFEKEMLAPPKNISRMPSFLSETTEGNEALRSLYLPNGSQSDATLPKLQEEETVDGMNSPRLSVLSESSFVSVYGDKNLSLDNTEPEEELPRRNRSSSAVEKWVDERPIPVVTPPRPGPRLRIGQFESLNGIIESPLQRLEKLKHTMAKTNKQLSSRPLPEQSHTVKDKRKSREIRHVFTDKTSFEHQQTLPPTPDTISTNTLRHYQNSNDTLAQDHAREGTFFNSSSTFAGPGATQNAFQSTLSIRPRSAGETVTSRREGHGWDTPSQEDNTDAGSVSSTLSSYPTRYSRQNRVIAPDLFTFGGGDWGRDMMYNKEPSLPAHTASRYDALRRSSMAEQARSDDTVMNYNSSSTRYDDSPQYGTIPIDTTPQPELPDRRSSLSAVTKLRKTNPTATISPQAPMATTTDSPASPSSKDTKKSRIPNLRLFGRSDTSPAINNPKQPSMPQSARPKTNTVRSQSYFTDGNGNMSAGYEDEEQARATPPPIKRTRPGQSQSGYRPASAGTGIPKRAGGGGFAYEQEEQVQERQTNGQRPARRGSVNVNTISNGNSNAEANGNEDDGAKGGRKWFGIGVGRSNSVRRN